MNPNADKPSDCWMTVDDCDSDCDSEHHAPMCPRWDGHAEANCLPDPTQFSVTPMEDVMDIEHADEVIADLKRTIKSIDDLLTPDERASLNADLAEMARIRRRAEAASANWPMP